MIKEIKNKKTIFGYIIKYNKKKGTNFLTPPKLSYQVAYISHKKKHTIKPHLHYKKFRKINSTSEILLIQKGKLRVDFYSTNKKYVFSKILTKNDIIILLSGAHGFKVIKPVEMIEIKQGPYHKSNDKLIIRPAPEEKIKII